MSRVIRIAAVGDLHCTKASEGAFQPMFSRIAEVADVLAMCGDLTDRGLPDEARVLAKELQTVKLPKIAVLGNHDFETEAADAVAEILTQAEVTILDGTACEVSGVGFAGVKGFAGGFGDRALQPWGEEPIKMFVRTAVEETLKLESALARLTMPDRVVLLHYAPVRGTVDGEPLEIYSFLGSSRLEEPLNRYAATVVFHGHAHHGRAEGVTAGGARVYNVAIPVLQRLYPDGLPFRVVEVPIRAEEVVS